MNKSTGFFDAWMEWLSMASIQAIVFILFVLATCWLIRKSSQWAQCWLWRLVFLKLVLLLVFVSPVQLPILPHNADDSPAAIKFLAVETNTATDSYLATNGESLNLEDSQASIVMPSETIESSSSASAAVSILTKLRPLDLRSIFLALWLTGVAIGIAALARAFHAHSIFRSQLIPIKDWRYFELLAELGRQFRVSRTPMLALSEDTQSPCLTGLFNPVIVIPENLADEFDDGQIEMILAHELAHHKRLDLWWCWLPTVARIAFFFNPLVWVALKKWNIAREMACDELVLNVTNFSPATYGEVLVNIASKTTRSRFRSSPASISMVQSSSLKRRLLAMSHLTKPGRFSVRTISFAFLVSLIAMVGLVPWQPVERRASAQEPHSTSTHHETLQEKLHTVNEPKAGVSGKDTENQSIELTFADLKFDIGFGKAFDRSFLPEKVKALEGKEIVLSGYMRPSFKASDLKGFVFVRDNKADCFGPGAPIYDCVMVHMKEGMQTDYLARRFKIRGTFNLQERKGPDGKPWAIYRMENTTIVPTLLDSETTNNKIRDRDDLLNELRKYQANFKNRFDEAMKARKKLESQHKALKLEGHGSIHAVMVIEIAKSMHVMRTKLRKLQNERSRYEREEAAGSDAIKARAWQIKQYGKGEATTASLERRILEARANAELIRQKVGAEHPDFEAAAAIVKIAEQHLATVEKEYEGFGTGDDEHLPETIFVRKKAELDQSIKDLKRSLAEEQEQWTAHNREAIRLSNIQEEIKRLDIELEEIRASQRLGAELLLQLRGGG